MRTHLKHYRLSYNMWRQLLGNANKSKAPKHVKSQIMSHLNKSRNRLQKEMDRVSWLLWPETGRPAGCPIK